jgi:hypothetical protein
VESDKARILTDIDTSMGIDKLNNILRGIILRGRVSKSDCFSRVVQCAACGDAKAIEAVLFDPSESLRVVSTSGYIKLLEILKK